jgi:hypothetical protein
MWKGWLPFACCLFSLSSWISGRGMAVGCIVRAESFSPPGHWLWSPHILFFQLCMFSFSFHPAVGKA